MIKINNIGEKLRPEKQVRIIEIPLCMIASFLKSKTRMILALQ